MNRRGRVRVKGNQIELRLWDLAESWSMAEGLYLEFLRAVI